MPEPSDIGTAVASASVHSLLAEHLHEAPLNATQVARMTRMDSELARVYKFGQDSGGLQDIVDSTVQSPELLELWL